MKKVERVSIGRYAFTLEEDAGRELENYLEALRKHYSGNPDCEEIVDAFEDRMAELLIEGHGDDGIITTADIDAIKARIGAPESFGDEAASGTSEETSGSDTADSGGAGSEWWKNDSKKKMFRPRSGRILGGVAAALAARFNLDVTLMRAIWCLLGCAGIYVSDHGWDGCIGVVLLAYIILWICIPSANPRQDRMMEEKAPERSEFWKVFGNICRIFVGGILALTGFAAIMAGVMSILGLNILEHSDLWEEFFEDYSIFWNTDSITSFSKVGTGILGGLCFFIPFIVCLYEGIKICFGFKSPKWHPGLILSLIWLFSLIAACIVIACTFIPTLSL